MAFFHHNSQGEEEAPRRRNSVRDLQAKAYAKWVSQGAAPKHSKSSGFEAERSRRRFWRDQAAHFGIVMTAA
jgi:hypothetical protein